MATVQTCDSCGAEMKDVYQRMMVTIPATGPQDLGTTVDLCPKCYSGIVEDPKVKKASNTAKAKRAAQAQ